MVIYFDGGCSPNPGVLRAAITVDGISMMETQLGYGTNNVAEWVALIWALETALSRGATEVEIIGDSKLVVMQATNQWKIKQASFLPFKAEADRLIPKFKKCLIRHVKRDYNLAGIHIENSGK